MNTRRVKVKDDNTNYVIYYPFPCYQLPPIGDDIPDEGCQSVSIDIGYKNFAIRIERRYRTGQIQPIYFEKIDFTKYGAIPESKATTVINPQILLAIYDFLKTLLPTLSESRLIGIERQMGVNYSAARIFQHVLSFFMMYCSQFKYPCVIFDISPKLKGKMLGAPKGMTYNQLKEWSIVKARELLSWRGDNWSLAVIDRHQGKSKTKADDLADTVIQMEAWFILVEGMTTREPKPLYL